MLGDTVNARAVRILLECILVFGVFPFCEVKFNLPGYYNAQVPTKAWKSPSHETMAIAATLATGYLQCVPWELSTSYIVK